MVSIIAGNYFTYISKQNISEFSFLSVFSLEIWLMALLEGMSPNLMNKFNLKESKWNHISTILFLSKDANCNIEFIIDICQFWLFSTESPEFYYLWSFF